jgi:23S rRNA (guanosine2251-2'-O)-methyltransferase
MKVLLHNIRSCHNVGSIFRTSDALGVSEIILSGYTPLPIDKYKNPNKAFIKVSLGAESSVSYRKIYSLSKFLDQCLVDGWIIVAMELAEAAVAYTDLNLSSQQYDRTILLVGNEKRGLSKAILRRAAKIIMIPMNGKKESLNVSIAFAIGAFHLRDTRKS